MRKQERKELLGRVRVDRCIARQREREREVARQKHEQRYKNPAENHIQGTLVWLQHLMCMNKY